MSEYNNEGLTPGERLQELRLALGYPKRPAFAELMGMHPERLKGLERNVQKMNQDDFQKIYSLWPWSIGFILGDEPLCIPDNAQSTSLRDRKSFANHLLISKKDLRDIIKELLKNDTEVSEQ